MITPKNWKSFQHYNDRKPSWIKLHRSLLDDFEFSRLPVASRALAPLLWLLASEYDDGIIPCDEEELAFRFRMSLKDTRLALSPLIECGFFASDSTPLADCKQDASLEEERETQVKTEIDFRAEFEKFKEAYPKRNGSQGWSEAEKLFRLACKHYAPDVLISSAKRYSNSLAADKIGTEFVPMGVKFLRRRLYLEFIPTAEDMERSRKAEEFLKSRGFGVIEGGKTNDS